MKFRYVCLMANEKAIGVMYYQIIERSLADSLQGSGLIKKSLASLFKTHMMISGNTLVTGEYGYHFMQSIDNAEVFKIVDEVSDLVKGELKKEKIKVGAHLKKDYAPVHVPEDLSQSDYTLFQVQPNMHMDFLPEWKNFDGYLAALKSKYRVRLKRARKKSASLIKRELQIEDIEQHKEIMYSYYLETVDGAGFNLFHLNKDYNLSLKAEFGDKFKVWGYFEKDESGVEKLIGYYTLLVNYNELDAHFLGYNHKKNAQYQTYFNFLIDMVEYGVNKGYKSINMSRTALEIKSSVGAQPQELKVFMKYNGFMNRFLPRALDYFVPEEKWKARTPFK
jgi:hypothetical protein